jgi:hypothetical protein
VLASEPAECGLSTGTGDIAEIEDEAELIEPMEPTEPTEPMELAVEGVPDLDMSEDAPEEARARVVVD